MTDCRLCEDCEREVIDVRNERDNLRTALRNLASVPAVLQALGRNHIGGCECPLCVANKVLGECQR